MTDTVSSPPTQPTLADQVRAVDPYAVADRIVAQGTRGAIQASSVEILAMAMLLRQLVAAADLTFDMLATADAIQLEHHPARKLALKRQVVTEISRVGHALEALGYVKEQPTTEGEAK